MRWLPLLLVACASVPDPAKSRCRTQTDCLAGYVCTGSLCMSEGQASSAMDASEHALSKDDPLRALWRRDNADGSVDWADFREEVARFRHQDEAPFLRRYRSDEGMLWLRAEGDPVVAQLTREEEEIGARFYVDTTRFAFGAFTEEGGEWISRVFKRSGADAHMSETQSSVLVPRADDVVIGELRIPAALIYRRVDDGK